MARNNAPVKNDSKVLRAAGRGKAKSAAPAAGNAAAKPENHDAALPEWDEVSEDLAALPDIDGLIGKPAANTGNDAEARRRIERLREERQLQQALSDVFDL
jgi:hypothetical protein